MHKPSQPIISSASNRAFRASPLWRALVLLLFVCACFAFLCAAQPGKANPIPEENRQPGTTAWELTNPADNRQIEGYASLTSVPVDGDIDLFVNTSDATYSLTVYRMGWYDGKGGREVLGPQTLAGVQQVTPTADPTTGLIECHWTNPFRLHVPTSWVSGIYLVKLHGNTSGKESYIIFTVRDSRAAALVFQQSVTTYQAYNPWPGWDPNDPSPEPSPDPYCGPGYVGESLYGFQNNDCKQGTQVSFDRPYGRGPQPTTLNGVGAGEFLTLASGGRPETGGSAWEFEMVRWLERQGYDVTYITNVDTHEDVGQLLRGNGFLSVGHDEYWSEEMRSNAIQAVSQGISLGFFSGNYVYWPITFLPDSSGAPNRTISAPKDTICDGPSCGTFAFRCNGHPCDSSAGEDPHVSGETEQLLVGGMFYPDHFGSNNDIVVPGDALLNHWVFANTGLQVGDVIPGLIGIEFDAVNPDFPQPKGLQILLHTLTPQFGGYGDWAMTIYQAPSGAWVFNAATLQWSWGLDDYFTGAQTPAGANNGPAIRTQCGEHPELVSCRSPAVEQITRNVLNRFFGSPDVPQNGTPNFNVNTLHDHDDNTCGVADCTLREAINHANMLSGPDTVLFLVGGTITLEETLGPLTVTDALTLAGFGARAMTISGGNSTPVFNFSGGPSFLSGFTIRDGRSSAFLPTTVGGAGLFNTGELTVNVCAFVNNSAAAGNGGSAGEAGGVAQGGSIHNVPGGVLTFNRCTFTGNSAAGGRGANNSGAFAFGGTGGAAEGGAIFNDSGATVTLNNCTLASNSATGGAGGNNTSANGFGGNGGAGEGAGVFNLGTLNVRATTVARNSGLGGAGGLGSAPARNGAPGPGIGGIAQKEGGTYIRNSIAALNTGISGPDVAGAFTSEGYNFVGIGDTATGFNGTGDQVGTTSSPLDPNLGPLQDNGGPTDTLALLEGSMAIDTGHSFGLTSDQRGQPRPNDHPLIPNAPGGDGADIGAFEFGAVLLVNTLDDHTDGTCDVFDCSLREAIDASNTEVGDQFIAFTAGLEGTIQLNSALPNVTATAFLQGPGADRLAVRRNTGGDYRIFTISNGTANGPFVSIRGLTIADGNVGSDTVLESGGGILVDRSVVDLEYSALTGNRANSYGGAVYIAERSPGEPSQIQNCTFGGNTSTGGGGGGLCVVSAGAVVANSTFSGNSAINGGAMFAGMFVSSFVPELAVESCTLSGNNATRGGGISKGDGTVRVTNNIFNNNAGGSLHTFSTAPTSQGYNLSSDNGGGFLSQFTDQINTDPMLGPLQNNGGPTPTMALLPGSPAIDQGNSLGWTTDQRGFVRIFDDPSIANATGGDGGDIGAVEGGASLAPITAVSQKIHGATAFNIDLPLTGPSVGIECRKGQGASSDQHTVIVTFGTAITGVGDASATPDPNKPGAAGTVDSFSINGSQVTVNLTSVSNAQKLTINLMNVSNGFDTVNVSIPMGVLVGDVNGSGTVNNTDVGLVKGQVAAPLSAANFRSDVNVSGTVNNTDVGLVKGQVSAQLP